MKPVINFGNNIYIYIYIILTNYYSLLIRWDAFVQNDHCVGSASEQHTDFIKRASIGLKLLTTLLSFAVVLVAGCVSKGATFFMIAQMPIFAANDTKPNLEFCFKNVSGGNQTTRYEVTYGEKQAVTWMW